MWWYISGKVLQQLGGDEGAKPNNRHGPRGSIFRDLGCATLSPNLK